MSTAPGIEAREPRATYRLQLNRDFRFSDATATVSYLDALGISHCYCSPYLKSRSGSRHGYDVIDHSRLDPDIGTTATFERFCATLSAHRMGQILDIVPNHMAVMGRDNPWWLDVLENGPASAYADFFDIDWSPPRTVLTGKVLLPILHEHYGTVLESRDLRLVLVHDHQRASFAFEYYEHRFPIDPREYPRVLLAAIGRLRSGDSACTGPMAQLRRLTTALSELPNRSVRDGVRIRQRRRDQETLKRRLAELITGNKVFAEYVERCLEAFNGEPREAACRERRHQLLEALAFRLASWRVASHEINYRRFFDVNDLACLRMENTAVFDVTHRLITQLVAAGKVNGLRVDHPDGLYDPGAYFDRLQNTLGHTGADQLATVDGKPVYIVAEKILGPGEVLPETWRIHGTTGYDFIDLINRLFIHPNGMPHLTRAYRELTGDAQSFAEIAYEARKLIMETSLASELNVLVTKLDRIAEANPDTRDFGLGGLRSALTETIARLPVYRGYVTKDEVTESDRSIVEEAVATAKTHAAAADTSVFDFVCNVLKLRLDDNTDPAFRRKVTDFVMRLQQYTGAVAAKGIEDTAFYRYARLISMNEVGCHPDTGSLSAQAFHRANTERLKNWPHSMLASSTHDSKRSEDVRARISVLSELAPEWIACVERWRAINAAFKVPASDGSVWPDAHLEYYLYQTLIGVWPLRSLSLPDYRSFVERVKAHLRKSARETKRYTSWINTNAIYEQAVESFISQIMDRDRNADFLSDFESFQTRVSSIGLYTSLSQTLLRVTVPGVPDIYQGSELWRFDLADPDNRRPVDFERRRKMLDDLRKRPASEHLAERLIANLGSGAAKLYVLYKALSLRRQQPKLFSSGEYIPLTVTGARQVYLCAFARRDAQRTVVVLAPRWFSDLSNGGAKRPIGSDVWKGTRVELPPADSAFIDVFTGTTIAPNIGHTGTAMDVGALLAHFPVALLCTWRSDSSAQIQSRRGHAVERLHVHGVNRACRRAAITSVVRRASRCSSW